VWERLVNVHRIRVPRNKVLYIMRNIDPEGMTIRKSHRLKRRRYRAKGTNIVSHVDRYDKLKPYCFCIHGAFDGCSRRLEISQSKTNPAVITMYYPEAMKTLGVAPRLIRCDHGTENSTLSLFQPFFTVQSYILCVRSCIRNVFLMNE
jgi:hypothetical protein